jgi:hypothetical protein
MLKENKNPVGMPVGTVVYPDAMNLIKKCLTNDPQTISQIKDKVTKKLKGDQRFISYDTVKHYLDLLIKQGHCKKSKISRINTYCLP